MAQYTTGELAKLAGVTVRTVQFYDAKDLLKPSELTDGGRRLYSEGDLTTLRAIVFLKDLGFSLADIASILHEDNSQRILAMLVGDQEAALRARINEERERLDRLQELGQQLKHVTSVNVGSLGAMATIMDGRKKLRALHVRMLVVGLLMDVLWIGTLVYGILSSVWWPFAVGLSAAIVLGVLVVAYWYRRIAYICPEDHTIFRPPLREVFFAYHTVSTRKLTCPTCGYRGLCLEVYAPASKPTNHDGTLVWHEGSYELGEGCDVRDGDTADKDSKDGGSK